MTHKQTPEEVSVKIVKGHFTQTNRDTVLIKFINSRWLQVASLLPMCPTSQLYLLDYFWQPGEDSLWQLSLQLREKAGSRTLWWQRPLNRRVGVDAPAVLNAPHIVLLTCIDSQPCFVNRAYCGAVVYFEIESNVKYQNVNICSAHWTPFSLDVA